RGARHRHRAQDGRPHRGLRGPEGRVALAARSPERQHHRHGGRGLRRAQRLRVRALPGGQARARGAHPRGVRRSGAAALALVGPLVVPVLFGLLVGARAAAVGLDALGQLLLALLDDAPEVLQHGLGVEVVRHELGHEEVPRLGARLLDAGVLEAEARVGARQVVRAGGRAGDDGDLAGVRVLLERPADDGQEAHVEAGRSLGQRPLVVDVQDGDRDLEEGRGHALPIPGGRKKLPAQGRMGQGDAGNRFVPAAGARGMRALLALLALAVLLPGCIQPAAQGPLDPASAKAALDATVAGLLAGVPCVATGVPADKTSENLKPLAQVEYGTPGIHGEIDARGDWLLAARYADGGFEVVSVADPLHPQKVATYQSQEKSAYDVKWMPDNRSAVVGHTATIDLVDVSPVVAANLSADEIERAGVAPRLVSVFTYPTPATAFPDTNMHMLTTARIAGKDYVFVAPNDNTGVWVLQLSGEGDARKLVPVGQVGDVPLGGGPLGPHDMSLVWDEILHKPVLYVANGFEGWGAYDVSDPKSPQMLAL